MGVTATLIADGGGAAASGGDFFRSGEYLAAEGVTHTLRLEEGGTKVLIPVLVREIPGAGGIDAISPYGYPGGTVSGDGPAIDPAQVDWSASGLVSLFVRDRVAAAPVLAGGTDRGQVFLCDPAEPPGIRKRLREQVRRNARRGWETTVVDEPGRSELAAFATAYRQTMERADAADRYLFSDEYLAAVLAAPGARLVIAARDGAAGAAAIAVVSDGLIHYFLGGTADAALGDSPMKNVFAAMIELSEREGMPLHLGGGVRAGDSLGAFKRGFANREERFVTHEVVCDPDAYARLSEGAPDGGFFPAYRAGRPAL